MDSSLRLNKVFSAAAGAASSSSTAAGAAWAGAAAKPPMGRSGMLSLDWEGGVSLGDFSLFFVVGYAKVWHWVGKSDCWFNCLKRKLPSRYERAKNEKKKKNMTTTKNRKNAATKK